MKKFLFCTPLISALMAASSPVLADEYREKGHIDCASVFVVMAQSVTDPATEAAAGEYAIKAMTAAEAFTSVDEIHAAMRVRVPAIHQELENGTQTGDQLLEKARTCIAIYDSFEALGLQ